MKTKLIQKNLNGVVSDDDYKEQIEMLNSRITGKEIERSEYRVEETTVDQYIGMAESLFSNVSTMWLDATFPNKQRFQTLLFPKGIELSKEGLGTAQLGLPFSLNDDLAPSQTTLVPPGGIEPSTLSLEPTCSIQLSYGGEKTENFELRIRLS